MQFIKTLSAFAAFATIGLAQSTAPTPFILTLNYTATNIADPRLNNTNDFDTLFVSYANSSLFIGQISFQIYSEPFYATSGGGGLSFTSYHSTPTGFTQAYLFPNGTQPVGITIPHSGLLPPGGATASGFGFNSDGYLVFNGVNNFFGCADSVPNSFQIYWLAGGNTRANSDCLGPLFLTRTNVTLSSGDNF